MKGFAVLSVALLSPLLCIGTGNYPYMSVYEECKEVASALKALTNEFINPDTSISDAFYIGLGVITYSKIRKPNQTRHYFENIPRNSSCNKFVCIYNALVEAFLPPNVDLIIADKNSKHFVIKEIVKTHLLCPVGMSIHILKACYGSNGLGTNIGTPYCTHCVDSQPTLSWTVNTAFSLTNSTCTGKTHCDLVGNNDIYTDTCPGMEKVLQFESNCIKNTMN